MASTYCGRQSTAVMTLRSTLPRPAAAALGLLGGGLSFAHRALIDTDQLSGDRADDLPGAVRPLGRALSLRRQTRRCAQSRRARNRRCHDGGPLHRRTLRAEYFVPRRGRSPATCDPPIIGVEPGCRVKCLSPHAQSPSITGHFSGGPPARHTDNARSKSARIASRFAVRSRSSVSRDSIMARTAARGCRPPSRKSSSASTSSREKPLACAALMNLSRSTADRWYSRYRAWDARWARADRAARSSGPSRRVRPLHEPIRRWCESPPYVHATG